VTEVFRKLNNQNLEDVWMPAAEQFNGSGSYGNGGAMRISPVPLFAHKNYDKMIDIAEQSTKLTHTHPLGINGAILQVRISNTVSRYGTRFSEYKCITVTGYCYFRGFET
jgi:ADP-ribosylglycohydrolase